MKTPADTTASPRQLPSPDQRPDADVVLYDGNCPFCSRQVRTLARLDTGGRLAYLSTDDDAIARRYPDLTPEMLRAEMCVIDGRGRRHSGAAGLKYLSRQLPWLWPLALILHLPLTMPLWRWLYRFAARRRYHWTLLRPLCRERTPCRSGS